MKKDWLLIFFIVIIFVLGIALIIEYTKESPPEKYLDAYCQGWHDSERWKDELPMTRRLRFEVDSLTFKDRLKWE